MPYHRLDLGDADINVKHAHVMPSAFERVYELVFKACSPPTNQKMVEQKIISEVSIEQTPRTGTHLSQHPHRPGTTGHAASVPQRPLRHPYPIRD